MNWPMVKLKSIFEIARGGSPRPIDEYLTEDENGINWISIKDASNSNKYIEKTKLKIKPEGMTKSRLVQPGDFLLTNSMSFGRPYIMKTSGCIHDGWLVLSGDLEKIEQDFFYHLLGSEFVKRKFVSLAAGAVVKNLNINLVANVEVPLPPLAEQKRIAAILDKADAIRRKRQQASQLADGFLRSVFLDMFGDPIANPKKWDAQQIIKVAPIKAANKPTSENELVWLLNLDQIEPDTGKVISKQLFSLDEIGSSTTWFDQSHVLYSKLRPYLNKVVIPTDAGVATSELVPFRPNPKLLNREYLAALLQSQSFVAWANTKVAGAKMPRLSMQELRALEIPVPPLELQQKFKAIKDKVTHSLSLIEQAAEQPLFESLSQRAFAGEL